MTDFKNGIVNYNDFNDNIDIRVTLDIEISEGQWAADNKYTKIFNADQNFEADSYAEYLKENISKFPKNTEITISYNKKYYPY